MNKTEIATLMDDLDDLTAGDLQHVLCSMLDHCSSELEEGGSGVRASVRREVLNNLLENTAGPVIKGAVRKNKAFEERGLPTREVGDKLSKLVSEINQDAATHMKAHNSWLMDAGKMECMTARVGLRLTDKVPLDPYRAIMYDAFRTPPSTIDDDKLEVVKKMITTFLAIWKKTFNQSIDGKVDYEEVAQRVLRVEKKPEQSDFFTDQAATLFNVHYEAVTPEQRKTIQRDILGFIYDVDWAALERRTMDRIFKVCTPRCDACGDKSDTVHPHTNSSAGIDDETWDLCEKCGNRSVVAQAMVTAAARHRKGLDNACRRPYYFGHGHSGYKAREKEKALRLGERYESGGGYARRMRDIKMLRELAIKLNALVIFGPNKEEFKEAIDGQPTTFNVPKNGCIEVSIQGDECRKIKVHGDGSVRFLNTGKIYSTLGRFELTEGMGKPRGGRVWVWVPAAPAKEGA